MQEVGVRSSRHGIEQHGIHNVNDVFWNLPTAALYEHVVRRREGLLCHQGPLAVTTGHHTGRSPNDKFIVRENSSEDKVWWGQVNRPFDPGKFDALYHRLLAYLQMKDLYVQDCFAGAAPNYRVPIRVLTGTAWHSLFARTMFLRPVKGQAVNHVPEFTVIDIPQFHAVPSLDGTNSEAFIILNLGRRLAIIGGTSYAGEIKKTIFSVRVTWRSSSVFREPARRRSQPIRSAN
jgi:phosphoenolpyruvate carboxykinase (ATP)